MRGLAWGTGFSTHAARILRLSLTNGEVNHMFKLTKQYAKLAVSTIAAAMFCETY